MSKFLVLKYISFLMRFYKKAGKGVCAYFLYYKLNEIDVNEKLLIYYYYLFADS